MFDSTICPYLMNLKNVGNFHFWEFYIYIEIKGLELRRNLIRDTGTDGKMTHFSIFSDSLNLRNNFCFFPYRKFSYSFNSLLFIGRVPGWKKSFTRAIIWDCPK